jgi:hypothetical protein
MNEEFEKQKTILENLYRCRDLEINNLWQKGVFLAPFLILCFTGYGILLYELFKERPFSMGMNVLCIALCGISAIFSMLWIYMFKGSKAQYELCERAIVNYEKKLKFPIYYRMGTLRHNEIEFDNNLLSTKAGKFSPSKINIVIGQVSLCLWIICFIFHMFIDLKIIKINIPSGYSFIIGILLLILIFFCHKYIKSSYLSPSN